MKEVSIAGIQVRNNGGLDQGSISKKYFVGSAEGCTIDSIWDTREEEFGLNKSLLVYYYQMT